MKKSLTKILSILLTIVLFASLIPGQLVYAADVTKTGGPSEYLDSLTIDGKVITDCTEEMQGTGWSVKANVIFLQGYDSTGIIIDAKSGVEGISVVVVTSSKIYSALYGIQSDTGLMITVDGSTLDISAGYIGISCNGLLDFRDGSDPGFVNISCSDGASGLSAISQQHMSTEYVSLYPNVRLNINWITDSSKDVCGLKDVTEIVGNSSNKVGVACVVVKNSGTGSASTANQLLDSSQSYLTHLRERATVNIPDQEHLYINMNGIDDLAITVAEPVVGNTPATTATVSSDLITITEVGWLMDDSTVLSSTDVFEEGHTYRAWFFYTLDEGAEFLPNANITVNGSTADVVEQYRIGADFVLDGTTVFAFTTQPVSGTAKKTENYSFSWALSDTADLLVFQTWDGSYWRDIGGLDGSTSTVVYNSLFCDGDISKHRIQATKGTDTIYSDEFTVTWTEDAPVFAFTTQPASGTAKKTESYTFSWALNDTPDTIFLDIWLPTASDWGTSIPLTGLASYSETYKALFVDGNISKYRIRATKGADTIYSNEFTVTWTEYTSAFAFSTQPVSGTAKKTESYTFSWALNDTPDTIFLDIWLPVASDWGTSIPLTGMTSYSETYKALFVDGNISKYRIRATKGADTIYSNEFTVTWTEGSTPTAPTITTSTLPSGKVNTAYNQTLAATGDATITWTIDSGNLPAGLTLGTDGTISGTPTTAGDYTFTVKASNAAGDDTKEYTITIAPADAVTYTVTFDANGHGTAPAALPVTSGSTASKPADPTASGWTFGGWYQDATCSVAFDFATPITANITLYAKWTEDSVTPVTHTVTFETNGGSAVVAQTIEDGEKATKPTDPTKEGFVFDGWYQDATLSVAFSFDSAITADITLYAKWTEDTPSTVYYTVVGGGNSSFTAGNASDLVVTVKRSEADETCFSHFTGVQIDGVALVSGTDYTAVAGSTVVTIKKETLNNLSEGGHTINVLFDDGKTETSVTVKAAGTNNNSNTSGNKAIPATGETTSKYIGVAVLCFVTSGALFGVVLLERKKRKCAQ